MVFRYKIPNALLLAGASMALVSPSFPVRADAQGDARAALRRGQIALEKGDPGTARVELMNAIKADPKLAQARVLQARALLMLGNGKGAQDELEQARLLGMKPGPIRHLLAHVALLQGRYEDALKEATAADARAREAPFRARMEGQALQALGRFDEAGKAFDRAFRLAPRDGAVRADMARFNLAAGNMVAALRLADEAYELAPRSPDVLVLRALLTREQYGPEMARGWFDEALSVNPSYVPALIEYAATLADLGRASEALSLSRRALAHAPGLPRAYYIQAVIAARAGNYELARAMLGYTRGALDDVAGVRLLRGVLHLEAHDATLAVEQLAPLLARQPLNIRVRLLLARAYYEDGRHADAERALFPLVERADAGSYALTLAARIHEAMDNRPVAGLFLQRAARMSVGMSDVYKGPGEGGAVPAANPALAAPNLLYIRHLLEKGQSGPALVRARLLFDANPGAPAASMVLGDALMAAGRYRDAAASYERSANIRFRQDSALKLADAWQRAGEPEKSRKVLSLYIAQNPMDVEGQRLMASALLAAGEYQRAFSLLSVLRDRLGSEDALLMADMSHACIGLDQAERALPFAAHAYRLQPMNAVTSDALGWALFKAGWKREWAREYLEKAQSLAPAEPLIQLHLGQVYLAAGEREKARAQLAAAASISGFPLRQEAADLLGKL